MNEHYIFFNKEVFHLIPVGVNSSSGNAAASSSRVNIPSEYDSQIPKGTKHFFIP